MRVAGASRSLEPVASTSTQSSTDAPSSGQAVARSTSATPTSNSPWRKPSALNTSRVATGTRGLTITQGSFGKLSGSRVSPTPVMTQGREARQTGTSAPVNFATSIRRASSMARPFVCASNRSAAAASAEPPPMPAATGNTLSRVKSPSLRSGTRSPSNSAALNTRLSAVSPQSCASGPAVLRLSWDPGVRLTLARASSVSAGIGEQPFEQPPSTALAVFFLLVRGGRGGRSIIGQPVVDLGLDLRQFLRLRFQVAGMGPLEFRLQRAADAPIGVAEMVVDRRVFGLEIDRALEIFHRVFEIADAEIGPAQRVHDVAVVGPLIDGALDHLHALVEIDALIDPRITEIVQHMRLLGLQIERLAHIGLGLAPLLGALLADAAIIVIDPVGFFIGLRQCIDALRVGRDAVGELLAAPLDIAERHDGFDILGIFRRDGLQDLDGFIAALGGVEVGSQLNLRVALQRRTRRHALVDLDRHRRLLHRLIEIGQRQQRQRMIGVEVQRELQIDQREILAAAARQRRADAVQRLGGAGLRRIDQR